MRLELSAYRREYYRMHREETLATNKAWRDANPERRRLDGSRRRALIREASVFEVTPRDLAAIVQANGGLCVYCGVAPVEHIDHVVPLVRGGSHSVGNLAGACSPCNLSKGKKLLVEWKRDKLREGVVSTHAFSG